MKFYRLDYFNHQPFLDHITLLVIDRPFIPYSLEQPVTNFTKQYIIRNSIVHIPFVKIDKLVISKHYYLDLLENRQQDLELVKQMSKLKAVLITNTVDRAVVDQLVKNNVRIFCNNPSYQLESIPSWLFNSTGVLVDDRLERLAREL